MKNGHFGHFLVEKSRNFRKFWPKLAKKWYTHVFWDGRIYVCSGVKGTNAAAAIDKCSGGDGTNTTAAIDVCSGRDGINTVAAINV